MSDFDRFLFWYFVYFVCKVTTTYRMAAGPLFVVVDEDVVPGERAHVEGVERAEEPHQGAARQGEY
jgi:hypothetical protein